MDEQPHWGLKEFATTSGRGVISEFRSGCSEKEQAEMDAALLAFRRTRRDHMSDLGGGKFKKVTNCGDNYRIKFKVRKVQFRILGYWGPGDNEFTMLVPFVKKKGKSAYRDPCKQAGKRRKIAEDEGRVKEYEG